MATKDVVDTHVLIWFLEGNPRLGSQAKVILEDHNSELVLPVIVIAEACWMIEHRRTSIPTVNDLLAVLDADPRGTIAPFDRNTLDKTLALTGITEMHDRQIVATALMLIDQGEPVALLSRDRNIRSSGLVSVIW